MWGRRAGLAAGAWQAEWFASVGRAAKRAKGFAGGLGRVCKPALLSDVSECCPCSKQLEQHSFQKASGLATQLLASGP